MTTITADDGTKYELIGHIEPGIPEGKWTGYMLKPLKPTVAERNV